MSRHTAACAGGEKLGVRVLTCRAWAVGAVEHESRNQSRRGLERSEFEPLFRQRVVEVHRCDGALLSCRQSSRPCSVEQRDARACAAHVAGVIWDQNGRKVDSVDA